MKGMYRLFVMNKKNTNHKNSLQLRSLLKLFDWLNSSTVENKTCAVTSNIDTQTKLTAY